MSKPKISVYGKDEKEDMHLIKRGVTEEEALKAASHYCKETGGTAYFVYTEEE